MQYCTIIAQNFGHEFQCSTYRNPHFPISYHCMPRLACGLYLTRCIGPVSDWNHSKSHLLYSMLVGLESETKLVLPLDGTHTDFRKSVKSAYWCMVVGVHHGG